MNTYLPPLDPKAIEGDYISPGGLYLFEISGGELEAASKGYTRTPEDYLRWMIARREVYGSPLPEGFVPPPGIDIDAILKRLPPERK